MSANKNVESMAQQGEFSSRVPPSEPLTTKGHAPGTKVGNDALPEFHAETHPPGSAPAGNTFVPNTTSEIPGQAQNPSTTASTGATEFPGATSASVHAGFGKPASGMTSQEEHGGHRKKERAGLEGVGASISDPTREQRADVSVTPGARGKAENPSDITPAQNLEPASAEEVAAERS